MRLFSRLCGASLNGIGLSRGETGLAEASEKLAKAEPTKKRDEVKSINSRTLPAVFHGRLVPRQACPPGGGAALQGNDGLGVPSGVSPRGGRALLINPTWLTRVRGVLLTRRA